VVTNPGGLYGITVDRLGKEAVTSARNMWLVNICQYLRSPESGGRIIEALATGIPTIANSLAEAGLPPACYTDAGIRFTAVVKPGRYADPLQQVRGGGHAKRLTDTQQRIAAILASGPRSVAELQPSLGLSASGIRKALAEMRQVGSIEQIGGRGKATLYRLPK